jgi:hypothetical protein
MERPESKRFIDREIHEHEVFLAFNSDDEAIAFHEWWDRLGWQAFQQWVSQPAEEE